MQEAVGKLLAMARFDDQGRESAPERTGVARDVNFVGGIQVGAEVEWARERRASFMLLSPKDAPKR